MITVMLLHLDTDFAGDTDDAAALAMLLGWPSVELAAVTTVADPDGQRAGYVQSLLRLAGRNDVPVAAGAGRSLTTDREMGTLPDHATYWADLEMTPAPGRSGDAIDLLAHSVELGATLLAIGPYTNLASLHTETGALTAAPVVVMGGWIEPPARGLPPWGPEMDWNVQCDTAAALTVFEAAQQLTLVTLAGTLKAHLRASDLPRLQSSGPIGALLARQGQAHAADHRMADLGRQYPGLPDDLLNFHYDPLAGAVALGWTGATVESYRLVPQLDDGHLRFHPDDRGKPTLAMTDVDGEAFSDRWLTAIEHADRSR
jgi:purine nucleosidase